MTTKSPDRTALAASVHCSRWLVELRQRADRKLDEWKNGGLSGDRTMAIDACKSVAAQAAAEDNRDLAEKYDAIRVQLIG